MFEKGKAFARTPKGKGIGIGGLSATTLFALWQLFVGREEFATYKQAVVEERSVHWREIKELEVNLNKAIVSIARLQGRTRSINTNPP